MKVETGLFGASRNRDRLSRAMKDVEEAYAIGLKQAFQFIETVKIDRRQKKDEKRRETESYREQLLHEARRFESMPRFLFSGFDSERCILIFSC